MRLFDTHAHLNDERFDADRDTVIATLPAFGISRVIDVACDVRKIDSTLPLLEKYDFIYGAVGMHPHEAAETTNELIDKVAQISAHEKMLAIGEIGLDYHYDFAPRDVQKKWFTVQLELAAELKLPVILHIREAFGDCMDILRAHKNGLRGIMHCYSGSLETAYECMDLGLYIAFGGSITFNNATKLAAVAGSLPLERILIETDCPYMTPTPYRGKRNDPSYVRIVAEKLADLHNVTLNEVADTTYKNACEVFEMKENN